MTTERHDYALDKKNNNNNKIFVKLHQLLHDKCYCTIIIAFKNYSNYKKNWQKKTNEKLRKKGLSNNNLSLPVLVPYSMF